MRQSAKAFAPGNISCIFQVIENELPEKSGSIGLGFTINEGVTVTITKTQETQIQFNEKKIIFPTIETVLKKLTREQVTIGIVTRLPLGGGFGVSGASALATAYALNDFFALGYTSLHLAKIAHIAEVENNTGLGDVTNQYYGGCILKIEPSFTFTVKKLPVDHVPVYCRFFTQLSTKSILLNQNTKQTVSDAASVALEKIYNQVTQSNEIQLSDILSVSYQFAKESGLLTDKQVAERINAIQSRHGSASMIMLGNSVMSTIPFPQATKYFISSRSAQVLT